MNLAAARAAIAAIAKFCPHDEWRLQAIEALEYLDDEDDPETAVETPEERKRRLARDRQARKRGKRHAPERDDERDNVTPGHAGVTPDVTLGHARVTPSRDRSPDLSLSEEFQDFRGTLDLETREGSHAPRHAPSHADVTLGHARRVTNVTDDGCMGFAIASWREGFREVMGHPITLAPGVARHLVEVLVEHCPDPTKRETWAHEKAAAWARARSSAGFSVNPLNFADWLAAGEKTPARVSGNVTTAESPAEREHRMQLERDRQRRRDEEWHRASREAVPMPEEARAVIHGGPKKAAR